MAIRFANWIGQQGYSSVLFGDDTIRWLIPTGENRSINPEDFMSSKSTMQLYSLFLETESHELAEENSGNQS